MTTLSAALKEKIEKVILAHYWKLPEDEDVAREIFEVVAEKLLREAREETFEKLVSCMPSSAENLSNITPEDAKKTITAFLRVPYTCDQKDTSVVMESVDAQCEVCKNDIGHPSEKTGGGYCSCICHSTREVTDVDIDAAIAHLPSLHDMTEAMKCVDRQIGGAVKRLD